jgi:hypothetical protein
MPPEHADAIAGSVYNISLFSRGALAFLMKDFLGVENRSSRCLEARKIRTQQS